VKKHRGINGAGTQKTSDRTASGGYTGRALSMIPKSGYRFLDKIMLQQDAKKRHKIKPLGRV
jgi:hypothetical protein